MGERLYHDTFSRNANTIRHGEDGHANPLGYQVNRLLSGNNIVSVLRRDSFTSCCIHDCVMNHGVDSPPEQNPVIFCQILK
jgi:hypothetical protein